MVRRRGDVPNFPPLGHRRVEGRARGAAREDRVHEGPRARDHGRDAPGHGLVLSAAARANGGALPQVIGAVA